MTNDVATIETNQQGEQADKDTTEKVANGGLFHRFANQDGLVEERAAKGFSAHLEEGETILLANTVKSAQTGCLARIINLPDETFCVALTQSRLLVTPVAWGKPSSKVRSYPHSRLATMHQKGKYWVLKTKDKKIYAFCEGWGAGENASDFMAALFAYFYDHASTVIVPPRFQGQELRKALQAGEVTVVISS